MPSHGFTLIAREAEQEPERVAVGGNGVGAGGPLRDETVGEERLQERRDGGHVLVPFGVSSRRAAAASRSGVAVRYQSVEAVLADGRSVEWGKSVSERVDLGGV